MLKRVTERDLIRSAVNLATRTYKEIVAEDLQPNNFEGIAKHFKLSVAYDELPLDKDGSYLKDQRKIVLNTKIKNTERRNFSFRHELMHSRIEDDPDILSDFADAYIDSEEQTMERMCDAGAAELLMPRRQVHQLVKEEGFSSKLIIEICKRFRASSLAAAFQLVNTASHQCHLVIAEQLHSTNGEALSIIYTGKSSSVDKYSISRGHLLPNTSLLMEVWSLGEGYSKQSEDCIPFASGTEWIVPCDACRFRGKVFGFYNVTQAVSPNQLTLF